MSISSVFSRALVGIQALPVVIETHLSNGLPKFSIVGLPATAVKESKDRVRSAIENSGFEFPVRHITINLSPADLPKEGGQYDLPIALSILAASQQIPDTHLSHYEWLGELSLSGHLRGIHGTLPVAIACQQGGRSLFVPPDNVKEAILVPQLSVFSTAHLTEVVQYLKKASFSPITPAIVLQEADSTYPDLQDIKGQSHAKRALEIAAAGQHSLLMIGPPGTGKTMLASRLPGLLPPLNASELLEVASLYSIFPHAEAQAWLKNPKRPFRSPHHSASAVALVGGGSRPKPGEISLAHQGVLFLDEFPEFGQKVLENLREPLESGRITIARAQQQLTFPAQFQLIAAMNPCPCGYLSHPRKACRCSQTSIARYHQKISGPILDRIDLHAEVPYIAPLDLWQESTPPENSTQVKARVLAAQQIQKNRQSCLNAHLSAALLKEYCVLSEKVQFFLLNNLDKLKLSSRAHNRILKVSRTIADLAQSPMIEKPHLVEAISYRTMDILG